MFNNVWKKREHIFVEPGDIQPENLQVALEYSCTMENKTKIQMYRNEKEFPLGKWRY